MLLFVIKCNKVNCYLIQPQNFKAGLIFKLVRIILIVSNMLHFKTKLLGVTNTCFEKKNVSFVLIRPT
jgi:hypothetical protein